MHSPRRARPSSQEFSACKSLSRFVSRIENLYVIRRAMAQKNGVTGLNSPGVTIDRRLSCHPVVVGVCANPKPKDAVLDLDA